MRVVIASLLLLFSSFSFAYKAQDDRGPQEFSSVPQKVVVLDWNLLESVVELGIEPIGAPELDSYSQWVVHPKLPTQTQEVGTRSEPNLEKIANLHPDLIIASDSQMDLLPQLEAIAPVMFYTNFSERDDHAEVAIKQFKQLAQLFNKQSFAKLRLEEMDQRFSELRQQLEQHFPQYPFPVVLMRFANLTSTYLNTENSIPQYVTKRLGLSNPLPQPAAKWGIVQKPLSELQYITDGYILYIRPFNQEKQLSKSMLWRALPEVRKKHVNAVESVWSYGGAMSIQYMAEAVVQSLLQLDSE